MIKTPQGVFSYAPPYCFFETIRLPTSTAQTTPAAMPKYGKSMADILPRVLALIAELTAEIDEKVPESL